MGNDQQRLTLEEIERRALAQLTSGMCAAGVHTRCSGSRITQEYERAACTCECHGKD